MSISEFLNQRMAEVKRSADQGLITTSIRIIPTLIVLVAAIILLGWFGL